MALVLRKNDELKWEGVGGGGGGEEEEEKTERPRNVERCRKRDFTIARGDRSIDDR